MNQEQLFIMTVNVIPTLTELLRNFQIAREQQEDYIRILMKCLEQDLTNSKYLIKSHEGGK